MAVGGGRARVALKATDAGMGSHWWTVGRGGTCSDSAFRKYGFNLDNRPEG